MTQPKLRIPTSVLLEAGPFYHATPVSNWESIQVEGLNPAKCDGGAAGAFGEPIVCLSPKRHSNRYVESIRYRNQQEEVVLLEVRTEVLTKLRLFLDTSSADVPNAHERFNDEGASALLADGMPAACLDTIVPEALSVHCRFPRWTSL